MHRFVLKASFFRVVLNVMTELKQYIFIDFTGTNTHFKLSICLSTVFQRVGAMTVIIRLSWTQLSYSDSFITSSLWLPIVLKSTAALYQYDLYFTHVKSFMSVLVSPFTVPDRVQSWKLEINRNLVSTGSLGSVCMVCNCGHLYPARGEPLIF